MSRIDLPTAHQKQAQYVKRHHLIRRDTPRQLPAHKKQHEHPQLAFSRAKVYEMLMGFTATPFKSFVASITPKTNEIRRNRSVHYR